MFQKLIDKGKCSLGFHSGEWRYENPASCVQAQVCERCAKRSQRTQHSWGDWNFVADGDCTVQRACPRCGEVESKVEHTWSVDQYYKAAGSCETVRICDRCSAQQDSGVIHDYSAWQYRSEDACQQVLVCSRCGASGSQERLQHEWSAWQYSPFYKAKVNTCQHCGATVVDADGDEDPDQLTSLQAAYSALVDTLSVQTVPELRQKITDHQEVLFSPALSYLSIFLEDQAELSETERENLNSGLALIETCRQNGIEAVFAQAGPSPAANPAAPQPGPSPTTQTGGKLDANLVGRWRHTSIDSSGSFSQVTDYYLNLDGAGNTALSSKTVNNFGEQTSPIEYGSWSASGGYLTIDYPGRGREVNQYTVEGNTLFFPDRARNIWERY